jgi:two-component system chemotaxis response regulator CheY
MEVSYLANVKILVIDDLPYTRSMVRQILKVLGGRNIKDAPDGAKALKIMKTFEPDLIILDWEMKPMNGIEFTRNVRDSEESSNPFVPIIMLSGYTNKDRVIDAPRPFIRIEGFFGPDRRRRETKIDYTDRRNEEPETGQAMS